MSFLEIIEGIIIEQHLCQEIILFGNKYLKKILPATFLFCNFYRHSKIDYMHGVHDGLRHSGLLALFSGMVGEESCVYGAGMPGKPLVRACMHATVFLITAFHTNR
ncbi:MAG: hypothetical protein ACO1NO_10580 [Burkholderiaceae bacterium]